MNMTGGEGNGLGESAGGRWVGGAGTVRESQGQSGRSTTFQDSFLREGRGQALVLLSLRFAGFSASLRPLSTRDPHTLEGSSC